MVAAPFRPGGRETRGVMAEGEQPPPLEKLGKRLAAAREAEARRTGERSGLAGESKGYGFALRLAIELVSSLAVGVLLGWGLDSWLGTRPWFLVVFFFLGAAAGALNLYRLTKSWGQPDDDKAG